MKNNWPKLWTSKIYFFRILKTEMFYDQEDQYENIEDLKDAIEDYINYYNYDRIKVKLKGLSPVNYRL